MPPGFRPAISRHSSATSRARSQRWMRFEYVAKASLQAFVSLVETYRTSGRLTLAEAQALIDAALSIAEDL